MRDYGIILLVGGLAALASLVTYALTGSAKATEITGATVGMVAVIGLEAWGS